MKAPEVAVSTVAASMFSTLNVNGAMSFMRLLQTMALQGFTCTIEEIEAGARELLNRNLVGMNSARTELRSKCAKGWVVAFRNREDLSGWSGWTMKNLSTGEHKLLADMQLEH